MKHILQQYRISSKGFSLVEFIVIISIFAIMAGVALFNFSGFNSAISLNNLAHDIALTIRQAQVYGISATTEGSTAVGVSQIRGVYFPYTVGTGFDTEFVIFLDTNPAANASSVAYDGPAIDVDLDRVTITTQDRIVDIATGDDGISPTSCNSEVIIAFERPNPTPHIFCGATPAGFARITVKNPTSGNNKYIEVWPTGQIAVVTTQTSGGQP